MIILGGDDTTDVWALTNANGLGGAPAWVQLTPSRGPPESLEGAVAIYDQSHNIVTTFGGYWCFNSVWSLSNANGLSGTPVWTNLIPNAAAGSPGCRDFSSGV